MAAKRAFGIDVSYAQKTFNPPDAHDLDFVALKASQANFADHTFEEYYPAALKVPVRGAYHYFVTSRVTVKRTVEKKEKKKKITTTETVQIPGFGWQEQVEIFLQQVKDKDFHFFALDLESYAGTHPDTQEKSNNLYTKTDVQGIRHWVDEVHKRTGKKVLLYTRATVFRPFIQPLGGEVLKDIDFWIARYPNDPSTSSIGTPFDGNALVKIPGVSSWRFWQYSDRNNGKGASYGAKTKSIDLNVYNGSVEDLRAWLGLAGQPVTVGTGENGDKPASITGEKPPTGIVDQIEEIGKAGGSLVVRFEFSQEKIDLALVKKLLAMLKGAGITPQVSLVGEAGDGGGSQDIPGEEPAGPPKKPPISAPEKETSFVVTVQPKTGKKTALQSFTKKDAAGKPIMMPLDTLKLGERVTREAGDRLCVSSDHKLSKFDKGDGRVRGADNRFYYLVTKDAANGDAVGLYVKEADVEKS